jgi:hypothetical protein
MQNQWFGEGGGGQFVATVAEAWRRFLIDRAFAQNYRTYFWTTSFTVRMPPANPVFDRLLPSLLHVKALTVLDAALKEGLAAQDASPKSHGYKDDLNGRINTAGDLGIFPESNLLHEARRTRNDVAHEFEPSVSWTELEDTVQAIQQGLSQLGLVGPMPKYEVNAERKPKPELNDPKARIGIDYCVSVVADGKVEAHIKWSEEILPIGAE